MTKTCILFPRNSWAGCARALRYARAAVAAAHVPAMPMQPTFGGVSMHKAFLERVEGVNMHSNF